MFSCADLGPSPKSNRRNLGLPLLSRGPDYLTATGYGAFSQALLSLWRARRRRRFPPPTPHKELQLPVAAVFRPSHPYRPSNAHPVRNPSAPDLLPGHGRAARRRPPHRRRQHPGEPPARSRG
jgi:hypothetical protein